MFTVAKIKADKCHKVKKRNTLSGTVSRCGSVPFYGDVTWPRVTALLFPHILLVIPADL